MAVSHTATCCQSNQPSDTRRNNMSCAIIDGVHTVRTRKGYYDMLMLTTSAERDLVLLVSYLCCSTALREEVCRRLAVYLEVDPEAADLSKADRVVDAEFNVLSALFRNLAQHIQVLANDPTLMHSTLVWFEQELKAAGNRRIDVRGY